MGPQTATEHHKPLLQLSPFAGVLHLQNTDEAGDAGERPQQQQKLGSRFFDHLKLKRWAMPHPEHLLE